MRCCTAPSGHRITIPTDFDRKVQYYIIFLLWCPDLHTGTISVFPDVFQKSDDVCGGRGTIIKKVLGILYFPIEIGWNCNSMSTGGATTPPQSFFTFYFFSSQCKFCPLVDFNNIEKKNTEKNSCPNFDLDTMVILLAVV